MTNDEAKNMVAEFETKVNNRVAKGEVQDQAAIEVARDEFNDSKLREAIELVMNEEGLCSSETQAFAIHAWKVLWSHHAT